VIISSIDAHVVAGEQLGSVKYPQPKYWLNRPIIRYAEVKPYFPNPLSNPFSNHQPTGNNCYISYSSRSTRLFSKSVKVLDNGPTSHITALVNRRGIEGGDIYYSHKQ
jgi:hypothetical protein